MHEHNPAHQRDPAQNRRYRHGLLLLVRNLKRPEVDILLLVMEAEPCDRKPTIPSKISTTPIKVAGFMNTPSLLSLLLRCISQDAPRPTPLTRELAAQ